jgi:putative protease
MSTKVVPELVMPGGDLHRVKVAFMYGADAVYVGLAKHSLRKGEIRFSVAEIGKAITHAHSLRKKLYVTFNIFAHNKHLKDIEKDMKAIAKYKPDAFIISDPGIIAIAKRVAKNIPIHLSTQANTLNVESVKFWYKQGVKRIVLGREVTLAEVKEIKKKVPKMELEVFVHGAMCISYSGRCLMSAALTGRSANLGECAQPCRWNYKLYLEESQRPGEYFELSEDDKGSYVMNSKDLCLIEHLDKIAPYVNAMKVEGRNKTDYYVAVAARTYREGLKALISKTYTPTFKKKLKRELDSLTHRDYTTGFMFGDAKKGETFPQREPIKGKRYLGYVETVDKDGLAEVTVKNKLEIGRTYELLTPGEILKLKITKMFDRDKEEIKIANPGETGKKVIIKTDHPLLANTFIRVI